MSVLAELDALETQVLTRLRELEPLIAEYQELRAVAERLGLSYNGDEPVPSATLARRAAPAPVKPRRRARSRSSHNDQRPSHREEVLRLVDARPGISVPELGQELGVDPTGLYRVVRKLVAEEQIVKDGMGLRLTTPSSAPA